MLRQKNNSTSGVVILDDRCAEYDRPAESRPRVKYRLPQREYFEPPREKSLPTGDFVSDNISHVFNCGLMNQ